MRFRCGLTMVSLRFRCGSVAVPSRSSAIFNANASAPDANSNYASSAVSVRVQCGSSAVPSHSDSISTGHSVRFHSFRKAIFTAVGTERNIGRVEARGWPGGGQEVARRWPGERRTGGGRGEAGGRESVTQHVASSVNKRAAARARHPFVKVTSRKGPSFANLTPNLQLFTYCQIRTLLKVSPTTPSCII